MANRKKWYALPAYSGQMTSDVDEYIAAWRAIAAPIERQLGVKMTGFDPGFMFTKGNPQGKQSATISLPLWFAIDLSRKITEMENKYENLRANMDALS